MSEQETNGQGSENMPVVLLVEDDDFLRDIVNRKLKDEKFSVSVAVNGQQALTVFEETKPDIVLLDLILPDINGFDILKELTEKHGQDLPPIIILSNLGQQEEIDKGLELGAKKFLIKAIVTPKEIVATVREVLGL